MKQAHVQFEVEKSFTWSDNKRYDFYLPDQDCIIEVHGAQHFGYGFEGLSGFSLEDQRRRDSEKMCNASKNGIESFVIIDASDTSVTYIANQMEKFLDVFGINAKIDRTRCEQDAMRNLTKETASMWNNGMTVKEMCLILGVSNHCVIGALKSAASIGLCDYSPESSHRRGRATADYHRKRRVRCITTGVEFDSIHSAAMEYGIKTPSNICRSCTRNTCRCGEYNGEKLSWEYVD